jgi:hypothetical protein
MTTGLIAAIANALVDSIRGGGSNKTAPAATYYKLHVGDPGAAGTANPSAGDATRRAFTQGTVTGGATAMNGTAPVFTNTGTTEVLTHGSVWDASSGGNCEYTGLLQGTVVGGGSVAIGTAGVITTGSAHGLSIGDGVTLDTIGAATGIAPATVYYVIAVGSSTTATLSATPGGSALTTTAGTGSNARQMPKWVSGNTFTPTAIGFALTPIAA